MAISKLSESRNFTVSKELQRYIEANMRKHGHNNRSLVILASFVGNGYEPTPRELKKLNRWGYFL